MRKKVGLNT